MHATELSLRDQQNIGETRFNYSEITNINWLYELTKKEANGIVVWPNASTSVWDELTGYQKVIRKYVRGLTEHPTIADTREGQ